MRPVHPVVTLFDVDNTLLDNDRVTADLADYLEDRFGMPSARSYWEIFEQLRSELGYADYLGALQRYRITRDHDPRLLAMSFFLTDYPFAERLYPGALEAIRRAASWGPTVILTDGDAVFQPLKIKRSGLYDAVEGRALIYIHKEQELDQVERRYPAEHYLLVDDKLRILTAVKRIWSGRVTTVFPVQGHYALDPKVRACYPEADVTVERIGDLASREIDALVAAGRVAAG
jgi:FMN phosphatase YigB (HAD superfamily)